MEPVVIESMRFPRSLFFYTSVIEIACYFQIRAMLASYGRGASMMSVVMDRQVPARPLKLIVAARTEYGAPILALTGTVYQVKGVVEFTPEANKTYTARGELGEDSSVWIEEDESKSIVGAKVEKHGAKLGVFEK